MRALRIAGLVVLLGWGASTAGCGSDDDEAPSAAGTGGAPSAQGGGAGRMGSGGAAASGGTASGDAGSNGDAGSSSGGSSSDAGAPNGDAGDANAGAAGAAGAGGGVPYANVVSVVVASGSDGAYTFSVSIESSDIDCSQYANWWEVLTEDGALTYRRILDHSHTDANGSSDANKPGNTFTRLGGPVPIAADTVVLVRAHLSTGGYNGSVMRGSALEGFTQAPEIGADFATDVEDDPPQSTGCAF